MVDKTLFLSFGKSFLYIQDAIDVLLFVEYNNTLEFLFSINSATRYFLEYNYQTIKRGFQNEGLHSVIILAPEKKLF